VPASYFDERIAKSHEAKWPNLFEPAVVDPAVSFLADPAGSGAALELGMGTGSYRVTAQPARRSRAWDRTVAGHGRGKSRDATSRSPAPACGRSADATTRHVRRLLHDSPYAHDPLLSGRGGRL
jgi:hypothetical protein